MHKSDYYEACYVINLKRTDNGDDKMVTAIVLLTVEKDKVHSIAEKLADMKEITEVYSIAGKYDLGVIVRCKGDENLEEFITDHLLKVEGITNSETLIAFRVYSRYDLERMFDMD